MMPDCTPEPLDSGTGSGSRPTNTEHALRELLAHTIDGVAGVLRREPTVTDVLSTLTDGLSRAASRLRPSRRAPLTDTEAYGWTQRDADPSRTDGVRVTLDDGRVSVQVEVSAQRDHQTLTVAADVHDAVVTRLQERQHVVGYVKVTVVEVRDAQVSPRT
ncbi:hypothetical protein [Citricoccus muralis]|uniref:Alkaline shock family protein YloU n=1 Tax=Citricoccus muralis TaxID=169134 RepID=A0ABY8H7B0_9MICC|nr:hypothetical protein [Citricoccus muralis]WFP16502.1 hypothetical protein P8192_14160 [Citricoccus muralis]